MPKLWRLRSATLRFGSMFSSVSDSSPLASVCSRFVISSSLPFTRGSPSRSHVNTSNSNSSRMGTHLAVRSSIMTPTNASMRVGLPFIATGVSASFLQVDKCRTFATKLKKTKIKPYSSYKWRFKLLANGLYKRWRSGKRHNAHSKTPKQRRQLRIPSVAPPALAKVMKKLHFQ